MKYTHLLPLGLALFAFAGSGSAQVSLYSQDFEGLDMGNPDALGTNPGGDGWLVGANVFDPSGINFLYNYFAFSAPNGGPAFSAITTGEGGAPQGAQQMVVYNDYNNADHNIGNQIEANVFQESVVDTSDVGKTYVFTFDAKRGDLAPPTAALAFIKILDPLAGFAASAFETLDTAALPTTWGTFTLSTTIDPTQVGHIFQIGFLNTTSNFTQSGIVYDNLSLAEAVAPPQIVADGDISGETYGPARAVQAVQTQFGDNASELDAAYGVVQNGRLHLALTGNIEGNFNKIEIFIDSRAGGENVFSGMPGNDGAANMTGLTFDAGFEADYHLIVRRGFDGSTDRFDVDIAELGTGNFSSHTDIFGGSQEGANSTGTGPGNASPIDVGYNNANVAGVIGGCDAADQVAAAAVTTGVELSIALSDLGIPSGDIKVCAFVNNGDHNFAANQFLGSLVPSQCNLGGDGFGNFTGGLAIDLELTPGTQFFTIPSSGTVNYCTTSANTVGAGAIMGSSGSTSIAADNLVLEVTGIPDDWCLFFYGASKANFVPPLFSGAQCIGMPTRLNPVMLASGNVASRGVSQAELGNPAVGDTLFFQCFYRDNGNLGSAANTSDALAVTFGI